MFLPAGGRGPDRGEGHALEERKRDVFARVMGGGALSGPLGEDIRGLFA